MRIGFSFGFRTNGLDFFYNGNLFGHATWKGYFIISDLDNTYQLALIPNLLNGVLDLAMWVNIE